MSVLLSSIFGDSAKEEKSASSSGLFDRSLSLPPRPSFDRKLPLPPPEKKATKRRDKKDVPPKEESQSTDAKERTVFVGNLPTSTTRKSLAKLFCDCGKVESTRLRSLVTTGTKVSQDRAGNQNFVKKVCANTHRVDLDARSCVQGYVVFAEKESVIKALKRNNALVEDGRRVRVDRATPTVDSTRSVFCGNLVHRADETSLRQHVCDVCGFQPQDVENVRIVRDRETQQCRGFGYVLFAHVSMVTTALQTLHGTDYKNRPLRVMVCGTRTKKHGASEKTKTERKEDNPTGALKRVLEKEAHSKKRKRGDVSTANKKHKPDGKSRRAKVEAKKEKRAKVLQKRIVKGMGKNGNATREKAGLYSLLWPRNSFARTCRRGLPMEFLGNDDT
eukprot:CAMPEP_0116835286 /NCGR_PEP_ID=MMETSP0418-20121206/7464_1 /TAXON_ID=1158023 /ORGANISM="Astrosyne radiata, Strain 13vi08-1A" /LENGTH=388 /DNA_ID=CAMNT_0004464943 /DNA_START=21 /DNA_END=1188 /DNA_ORIENTATION=-